MKSLISKSLPILFLVTALAFMIIFHHDDKLEDTEKNDFERFLSQDATTDPRIENDEEFKSISNGEKVIIVNVEDDDDVILETSQEDWENREDYYSQKYDLN